MFDLDENKAESCGTLSINFHRGEQKLQWQSSCQYGNNHNNNKVDLYSVVSWQTRSACCTLQASMYSEKKKRKEKSSIEQN